MTKTRREEESAGAGPVATGLFGLWLNRHLERSGLSPGELARRLWLAGGDDAAAPGSDLQGEEGVEGAEGVDERAHAIRAWQRGDARPSRAEAARLAVALGIPGAEHAHFVLFATSDIDEGEEYAPGSAGLDLDAPWRARPEPPSNLPVQLTSFVGRAGEVAAVAGLLRRPDVRLLTLLGPPGIGKTRLGIEAARHLLHDASFEDGVFFVALASTTTAGQIPQAIALALRLAETATRPVEEALLDFLRDKRALLVLDNMEQIENPGAPVALLLHHAPGVKVLATSRTALEVYGEHVWRVRTLTLPSAPGGASLTADDLLHSEAAALFVERARAVYPDLAVDEETAGVIAQICRKLEGLPLALELAAARANILSPGSLLERLENRLQLLTGGSHDLPPRQRTLRGAIEWSYNLLNAAEKRAFRRLSVFAGGFNLRHAEALLHAIEVAEGGDGEGGEEAEEALEVVASLVGKSLVRRGDEEPPTGGNEARFGILETLREYALQRLSAEGEEERARRAHALLMLGEVEAARPHLTTPRRDLYLRALDLELENIRAALAWAVNDKNERVDLALRLAGGLHWYWYLKSYVTEGRDWLEKALHAATTERQAAPGAPLGQALYAAGHLALHYYEQAPARTLLSKATEVLREVGEARDEGLLAYTRIALWTLPFQSPRAHSEAELERALGEVEEAAGALRARGDSWGHAFGLQTAADGAYVLGRLDGARAYRLESLRLYRQMGDKRYVAYQLGQLGMLAILEEDFGAARRYLEEAMVIDRQLGEEWNLAFLLRAMGMVLDLEGGYEEAARYYRESRDIYERLGDRARTAAVSRCLGHVMARLGRGEEALDLYRWAMDAHAALGMEWSVRLGVVGCAGVAAWLGGQWSELGARLLGVVGKGVDMNWRTCPPVDVAHYKEAMGRVRTALGAARLDALASEGAALALDDLLALARSEELREAAERGPLAGRKGARRDATAARGRAAKGGAELSRREEELLRLVAVGLSNAEIASRLFLSHNTVRAHLYSIFNKINVNSRTAAARYASEHGLA